jgi:phage terminase large subunit-like protein
MHEYYFDDEAANRVELFFERYLRHVKSKWAGEPFVLLPWQRQIVRDLFGWKREDGRRKYRMAYLELPRKAGKSSLAAGIALYLLFADGEYGAEVYSAAVDRDQAGIVFETAKQMILASPVLSRKCKIYKRTIAVLETASAYHVLSADAPSKHGLNAHGIIFDELHAQPDRELWDVLTTSTGAREQPLIVAVTTAGYDRNSICYEIYEYAKKVSKGIVADPSMYSAIYEAEEEDDWTDPKVWRKANPSLGVTVTEEYYSNECRKALEMPSYQNTFRRLYLNQWTQQQSRWIDLKLWDENGAGSLPESALLGRPCFGGLDLAAVSDLCAWVMVFPREEDPDTIDVVARFWCPEARLNDQGNKYRHEYASWARAGYLQVTPGEVIDYGYIKAVILEDAKKFGLVDLNIDRLFQGYQLGGELQEEGLKVYGMGQGFISMAAPMKEFERRLLAKKVKHGGNPVLRFMADGVVVKQDPAGNLKIDKANSQARVDGIVALVMAIDRAVRHQNAKQSVYNERGVLAL